MSKIDNKKIPTVLGTMIIVIIVITTIALVLKYEQIRNREDVGMENIAAQRKSSENAQEQSQEKELAQINVSNGLYKNLKYDYQFNVPSNLKLEIGSMNDPESLIRILSTQNNQSLFSINVEPSTTKNIDTWLNEYKQKISKITSYEGIKVNPPSILSSKKILVDSVDARAIVIKNMPYSNYSIVFIKNGFVYTLAYSGLLEKDEDVVIKKQPEQRDSLLSEFHLKHRQELDKIVESFKFIQ
ncbi:MAG: hypothetical protein WC120_03975 [Parcubacteria group bacterium]